MAVNVGCEQRPGASPRTPHNPNAPPERQPNRVHTYIHTYQLVTASKRHSTRHHHKKSKSTRPKGDPSGPKHIRAAYFFTAVRPVHTRSFFVHTRLYATGNPPNRLRIPTQVSLTDLSVSFTAPPVKVKPPLLLSLRGGYSHTLQKMQPRRLAMLRHCHEALVLAVRCERAA